MTKRKSNRLQTTVIGLVLILGGVLFGCVISEITMRLLPLPANAGGFFMGFSSRYMCSPTTGWIVRSNFQEFVTGPEYALPLRFNSAGLHDTDHTLEKADNVFRILLVGDSFAQAAQVQEVQTAHQQLEDILNEKLGNPERIFEVINAGISAWGASQELVYYREQGRLYQPDLVLLLFYTGNDIEPLVLVQIKVS